MSKLAKIVDIIIILGSTWSLVRGIAEFDSATTAIPFFRGLFWMLAGALAIITTLLRMWGKD